MKLMSCKWLQIKTFIHVIYSHDEKREKKNLIKYRLRVNWLQSCILTSDYLLLISPCVYRFILALAKYWWQCALTAKPDHRPKDVDSNPRPLCNWRGTFCSMFTYQLKLFLASWMYRVYYISALRVLMLNIPIRWLRSRLNKKYG